MATSFDIDQIKSVSDVIATFNKLDRILVAHKINQFVLFNTAYKIVTVNMQQASRAGEFTNPQLIDEFIVEFARYYFEAIANTLTGTGSVSPPWTKLNEYSYQKSAPIFISLMLGANAHINYDLPQALNKVMQTQNAWSLFGDMVKIDRLLMKSGKQIITVFEEPNPFLNFLKKYCVVLYYRPAMHTILYWRVTAWRSYLRLSKTDAALPHITNHSVRIAKRLLFIARRLS